MSEVMLTMTWSAAQNEVSFATLKNVLGDMDLLPMALYFSQRQVCFLHRIEPDADQPIPYAGNWTQYVSKMSELDSL